MCIGAKQEPQPLHASSTRPFFFRSRMSSQALSISSGLAMIISKMIRAHSLRPRPLTLLLDILFMNSDFLFLMGIGAQ